MKPFLQLRLWLRHGPPAERVAGGFIGLLIIALLVWAFIPSARTGESPVATGVVAEPGTTHATVGVSAPGAPTSAAQAGAASAAAGSVPGGGATGPGPTASAAGPAVAAATGSPGGAAAPSAASGPAPTTPTGCPQSTATGVTGSTINVGIILVDLGGLNSLLGISSYQDEEAAYSALFNAQNKAGGVDCRRLVPKYYEDNVLDASDEQAVCLQIAQDKVFAVLNNLYNPQEFDCLAQRHIATVFYTPPHTPAMQQYAPDILSYWPDYDRLIKDYVSGAQHLGLLAGQRIGILEQTCFPDENTDISEDLASIGLKAVATYNYGCTTDVAAADTPDQDLAAVLQFKTAGVTTVLQTARATVQDFASGAQGQGYDPKYVMMNDASMALIAGSSTPIPNSMNGTVAITTDGEGETNNPAWRIDPATASCKSLMQSLGLPTPDDAHRVAGQLSGSYCDTVSILVSAIEHAPSLAGDELAAGYAASGPLGLSYPAGPTDVTRASDPTGGQDWRAAVWHTSCTCWQVPNLAWNQGF